MPRGARSAARVLAPLRTGPPLALA
jgi:hypothetical protein